MNYTHYLFYDRDNERNDFVVCAPTREAAFEIARWHYDNPQLVWSLTDGEMKSCLLPIYTN